MKMNGASFQGFPKFSEFAQKKLKEVVPLLSDFQTIEQCAIEYRPETGACIDPHIDDCWVWGERVISINLLSDSVLTMSKYGGGVGKYNLKYHYQHVNNNATKVEELIEQFPIVRIPMPVRSLLVLYGPSRYEWEHCILRRDITSRRICMAYREFSGEYLKGGGLYEQAGKIVIDKAHTFYGQ
jgi:alkylated DNA repair protein alkB family protein 4